ncbi:MAG: nucleotidyltransferase family protein [Methanomicrobiales archaeon]|nr:nucleotidyltransferase family protein [Methanomicrobiales archaeon]
MADIQRVKELADIQAVRDKIVAIALSHGAHNIRIFGSFIRGEQKPDSDLDLLADIDPDKSLLEQAALIRELEELLNIKVDLVEPACLHWYIKDAIMQEAIPL